MAVRMNILSYQECTCSGALRRLNSQKNLHKNEGEMENADFEEKWFLLLFLLHIILSKNTT